MLNCTKMRKFLCLNKAAFFFFFLKHLPWLIFWSKDFKANMRNKNAQKQNVIQYLGKAFSGKHGQCSGVAPILNIVTVWGYLTQSLRQTQWPAAEAVAGMCPSMRRCGPLETGGRSSPSGVSILTFGKARLWPM